MALRCDEVPSATETQPPKVALGNRVSDSVRARLPLPNAGIRKSCCQAISSIWYSRMSPSLSSSVKPGVSAVTDSRPAHLAAS